MSAPSTGCTARPRPMQCSAVGKGIGWGVAAVVAAAWAACAPAAAAAQPHMAGCWLCTTQLRAANLSCSNQSRQIFLFLCSQHVESACTRIRIRRIRIIGMHVESRPLCSLAVGPAARHASRQAAQGVDPITPALPAHKRVHDFPSASDDACGGEARSRQYRIPTRLGLYRRQKLQKQGK